MFHKQRRRKNDVNHQSHKTVIPSFILVTSFLFCTATSSNFEWSFGVQLPASIKSSTTLSFVHHDSYQPIRTQSSTLSFSKLNHRNISPMRKATSTGSTSNAIGIRNTCRNVYSRTPISRNSNKNRPYANLNVFYSTMQDNQIMQTKGKNKKVKTYKDIKEERRQLEAMRKIINSDTNDKNDKYNHPKGYDNINKDKTKITNSAMKNNVVVETSSQQHTDTHSNNYQFHSQPLHDIRQRIHNMKVESSSLTEEEEQRSSKRKSKAQQLLDALTADPNSSSVSDNGEYTLFDMFQREDRKEINSTKSSSTPSTKDDDNTKSPTKTVPDTYWYNGNLQDGKGDYVTRWSRGVKVAEPLRKYDPIAAEKLLFRQPTKWLVRNVQIGFPLALWVGGVVYDIATNQEQQNRQNRAKQLLSTISGLGPAIIKGGQALASRSDLMPSEYLEELQKLQDDVPRFENEVAFKTVETELGVEFDSVFELVESDPIAAASIGQVYKARLRSNGDLVAIKIQRPSCEAIIALDLYVLRWWSGVANVLTTLLNRDINVQSIIDDFGELIYRELDYIAEAANAQRFSELYANQLKDVFVPKVYSELTTSKVLTMEWVEGFRLTDNESLEKYGLDRKKLVDTLVQCSLRQILGNGFFHADPHAGK